jgi:hypothetical protein
VYAMCAAAAMLGGVFRASLSVVVIFVEGSQARANSLQRATPHPRMPPTAALLSACRRPKLALPCPDIHSLLVRPAVGAW